MRVQSLYAPSRRGSMRTASGRCMLVASVAHAELTDRVASIISPTAVRALPHPLSSGASLSGDALWLFIGILAGLALGTPLGIAAFSLGASRLRVAVRPEDVIKRGVLLLGLVGGIGFTMSLFIAQLAFPAGPAGSREVRDPRRLGRCDRDRSRVRPPRSSKTSRSRTCYRVPCGKEARRRSARVARGRERTRVGPLAISGVAARASSRLRSRRRRARAGRAWSPAHRRA
jgi:Na+/H+ antiporter 1